MVAGGLVRMALSPFVAFGSYAVVRLVSDTAALAAGAVVMLAFALTSGGGRTGLAQA